MHDNELEGDEIGMEFPENGVGTSFEAGAEDAVFGETAEMELAAQLLEITDENELDGFIGDLIARATGGASRLAGSADLRGLLRQAARSALPMIGDATGNLIAPGVGAAIGSKLAAAAGNLFGLELEGMSPEDQEFEVARRFVRFAGAGARNARRSRNPRAALAAAARKFAPGFLRRRRRRPPRVRAIGGLAWPTPEPPSPAPPMPIEVTCHCCGATQSVTPEPTTATAPGDADAGGDAKTSPDKEPATSTEPQTQTTTENLMHDLDRTTMELNDEANGFEVEDAEYYGEIESPFSEEVVSELAASLLEVSDEQELDQFIGSLLKKARRFVGGALKSPLLQPLGGFIKGAIKKAIPLAGGALGNLVAPGIGGQIGSQLASRAGGLLGLELEGIGPEDQEFEVAKHLVRMSGSAVQNASQAAATGVDPQQAAKSAIIAAARTHVPGLVQSQGQGRGAQGRPRTGRWYRRGRRIVLVGV
jgi:hypothetical protein